ncbi:MAG: hypothetical protein IKC03_10665 [Oscillospiraceae bacterium]|nr:hypothetical protein [Oscillospiraceae bacterium]
MTGYKQGGKLPILKMAQMGIAPPWEAQRGDDAAEIVPAEQADEQTTPELPGKQPGRERCPLQHHERRQNSAVSRVEPWSFLSFTPEFYQG